MKPRMAIALLLATAIGVTLSHLQVQATDHGFLLDVDGRPVDVQGWWSDTLNGLQRDCARVQRLPTQDAQLAPALHALQAESPPASRTARITAAWVAGPWLLVQAEFDELLPAVVLLQSHDGTWTVVPQGVWSGQTHPWRAGPLIRSYLQGRVPNAPATLLSCFEPQAIGHAPADAGPH
ncbi:hypothetical protein [Limnohabitans sp. Jir72]|uniref:hypothetical protein n=1 Tax=Limnohabitans sp. Jir72 TaxID=1977909 RepID=UPI0011B1CBA3|nr:hypothetical protein [Limnohabitans sp. Jir72]